MADNGVPKRPTRRPTRGGVRKFGVGMGQKQEDMDVPPQEMGDEQVDPAQLAEQDVMSQQNEAPETKVSDEKKDEQIGGLKVNPLKKPDDFERFILRGVVKGNPHVLKMNLENGTAFCRFDIDVGTTRNRRERVTGSLPLEVIDGQAKGNVKVKDTDIIEVVAYTKEYRGKKDINIDAQSLNILPKNDKPGVKKYLMSFNGEALGLSQGVGETSANKYLEEYKTDLSKLKDPANLIKIGWNAEVAERVSQKAQEGERFRDLRVELQYSFGLKRSQVDSLLSAYGSKLDKILQEDPWSLSLRNISFEVLDRIAANRGAPMNSQNRIRAGVAKYVRDIISDNGSTCIPIGAILDDDIIEEKQAVSNSRAKLLARRFRTQSPSTEPRKVVKASDVEEKRKAKEILSRIMGNLDRSRSATGTRKESSADNSINLKVIREAIDYLLTDECLEKTRHNALKIYKTNGQAYLYPLETYKEERSLANKIASIALLPVKHTVEEAEAAVDEVSKNKGIKLSEEQREAAISACVYPMCVITGGAGTGKSTIQDIVCSAMVHMGNKVSLSAPTGKAAKRLAQTTKRPATTIHKQLDFGEVGEGEYDFRKNWKNPIEEDAVITDEGSMEDMSLANSHFDAFPVNGSMCIVGDYNQLSSVGAGQVLKDIINTNNEHIKVCRLTQTRRSSDDSNLMIGAHKVNRGEDPFANGNLKGTAFIDCDDEDISRAMSEYSSINAASKGLDYKDGYTALSPIRSKVKEGEDKGSMVMGSVPEINRSMKVMHNPDKNAAEKKIGFSVGDVVIGTKNNYSLDFRNGEEGIITDIFASDKSLRVMVSFDGGEPVCLTRDEGLNDIELAYANTVHKFQGSEKDMVMVSIPKNKRAERIMSRNLIYTMFTRASKEIVFFGDRNQFRAALKREEGRVTNLSGMINDRINELEHLPIDQQVQKNKFLRRLLEHRNEIYPPSKIGDIEKALRAGGVDLDGLSHTKPDIDDQNISFGFDEFSFGM